MNAFPSDSSDRPDNSGYTLSKNINRLLLELARDFEKRSLDKCHSRGYPQIRRSHYSLFSNMGNGPIRLTDLAEKAGITQQAMGKLVKEMEDEGYVRRSVDESDKRAKLIELTELGKRLVADNAEIVDEILLEYRDVMGQEGMENLDKVLRSSASALSLPSSA